MLAILTKTGQRFNVVVPMSTVDTSLSSRKGDVGQVGTNRALLHSCSAIDWLDCKETAVMHVCTYNTHLASSSI